MDLLLAGGDSDPDVFVIQPLTPLPAMTQPAGVWLDGRTQSSFGGETNPFGPEIVCALGSAGRRRLRAPQSDPR